MNNDLFDETMNRIVRGEKDALREIYDEYMTMVYSYIYDIVRNRQDAEDIAVEFFIKLWKNASAYKVGGTHKKWMLTVARNMALDFLRTQKQNCPIEDIETFPDEGTTLSEDAENKDVIERALRVLDSEERQLLTMKLVAGMTFKEISEVLGKPMGTVSWKYNEIIKKMREVYR